MLTSFDKDTWGWRSGNLLALGQILPGMRFFAQFRAAFFGQCFPSEDRSKLFPIQKVIPVWDLCASLQPLFLPPGHHLSGDIHPRLVFLCALLFLVASGSHLVPVVSNGSRTWAGLLVIWGLKYTTEFYLTRLYCVCALKLGFPSLFGP